MEPFNGYTELVTFALEFCKAKTTSGAISAPSLSFAVSPFSLLLSLSLSLFPLPSSPPTPLPSHPCPQPPLHSSLCQSYPHFPFVPPSFLCAPPTFPIDRHKFCTIPCTCFNLNLVESSKNTNTTRYKFLVNYKNNI